MIARAPKLQMPIPKEPQNAKKKAAPQGKAKAKQAGQVPMRGTDAVLRVGKFSIDLNMSSLVSAARQIFLISSGPM